MPFITLPFMGESSTDFADENDVEVVMRRSASEMSPTGGEYEDEEEEENFDDMISKINPEWGEDHDEVRRIKKIVLKSLHNYFRKLVGNIFPKPSVVKGDPTATQADAVRRKRQQARFCAKKSASAPPLATTSELSEHLSAGMGEGEIEAEIEDFLQELWMSDLVEQEGAEVAEERAARFKEQQNLLKKTPTLTRKPNPFKSSGSFPKGVDFVSQANGTTIIRFPAQLHKLKLLKEIFASYTKCSIMINEAVGTVTLRGSEQEIQEAEKDFRIQFEKLFEDRKDFTTALTSILRSSVGQKYISDVTAAHNECAVHVGPDFVLCAGFHRDDVCACLRELEDDVVKQPLDLVTLNQHDLHLLKQQVEKEYLVRLCRDENNKEEMFLEGFGRDVDEAALWLQKEAEDRQKDTDIFLLKGEARIKCFMNCFKDRLDKVKTMISNNEGKIHEKTENDRYTLKYHVRQGMMEEVRNSLKKIKESICEIHVDLKEEFQDVTDIWLLLEGLRKNDAKNFQATFDGNVKGQCYLDIEMPPRFLDKSLNRRRIIREKNRGAQVKKQLLPVIDFFYTGRLRSRPFTKSVIIRNTVVSVESGDISRFTADVLVCPVTKELDMTMTAVGQALIKRFGKSVRKKLSCSSSCDVIETRLDHDTAVGQVKVSAIYHVVLSSWQPFDVEENVKVLVKTCFALAEENKCKSIAFPLLGCGKRFKLPFESVRDAMIDATRATLSKVPAEIALKRVTFVLQSIREAQEFAEHLDDIVPCAADRPTNAPDQEDGDWMLKSFTTATPTAQMTEGIQLRAVLYGPSTDILDTMRARLLQEIRHTFMYEDTIEHAGLLRLSSAVTNEIREAATQNSVALTRPAAGGSCLRLKGEHHAVINLKQLIQSKLLQLSPYSTTTSLSPDANPRDSYHPPAYWSIAASELLMEEALKSAFTLVVVSEEERTAIENLVQATWDPSKVNVGLDAKGLRHVAIDVMKVERLENPSLYENYLNRRSRLLRDTKADKRCPAIGSLNPYSSGQVNTTSLLTTGNPLLRDLLHQEVNEHYLFHGTRRENLDAILRDGADQRLSNQAAMLGPGIYFGEAFTKSDRYADDRNRRTGGEKTVLLMRVLLGKPYIQNNFKPTKFVRPPCLTCKNDKCRENHSGFFDSVIDDCSFRPFRAFIVYESAMCYPEYVITYTRRVS